MTCVVHGRTLAWYASASARLSLALGVVFVLNMLAAAPPAPEVRPVLPIDGPLGIAGSLAMLTITGVTMVLLLGGGRLECEPEREPPVHSPADGNGSAK